MSQKPGESPGRKGQPIVSHVPGRTGKIRALSGWSEMRCKMRTRSAYRS